MRDFSGIYHLLDMYEKNTHLYYGFFTFFFIMETFLGFSREKTTRSRDDAPALGATSRVGGPGPNKDQTIAW
jgi:hypothetical protein